MLPLLITQMQECELSPFPRTLYPEDSAQSIFFTQKGIEKWFNTLLNDGTLNISGQQFPDMKQTLDLGVTKIEMILTDIVVSEFSVGHVDVMLKDNNVVPMVLAGVRFVLRFNWKIQQTSYPYVSDQGTGKVIVSDTDFSTLCAVDCDYDLCPNHLLARILHAELKIGVLKVVLDGGSSWMFQSMINVIMGVLQDYLQKFLTYFLSNDVVDILNDMFYKYKSYDNYEQSVSIVKDERFVSPWTIKDGYFYLLFSGYTYHDSNKSDEFITADMLEPVTQNRFNVDSEIILADAGFNNLYYIFHKYENAFSKPGEFEVLEAPTVEFLNSVALFTLKLSVSGSTVNIQLQGTPVYHRLERERHRCIFYFNFQKYQIESEASLDLEQLETSVVDWTNQVIQKTFLSMINSKMFEIEKYKYILDPEERVIRFLLVLSDSEQNVNMI
ncbi:Conserved_hypothetical protein [Hexamita inflata]|uniref:BPI-like protein n=1 Tax=Hexamita inflata TaxID=28002 RepID=A0AA86NIH7_9EUKA|nr:Conserved hypothetical protein [Hexamita inflata]